MGDAPDALRVPATGPRRVVQVIGGSTGGIGTHVADLARSLHAAGVAVTVCGPADTDARFGFSRAGVVFVPVDVPARPQPGDVRAVRALRRTLADVDPEVVHAHGWRAGFVAALARRRGTPTRLVVTLHNRVLGGGARARLARVAERYVVRAADVILGASSDLVARAHALGAADARLGPVAAPPSPPPSRDRVAVRTELGVDADTPLLLSVGRLAPQKSYETLVDAAGRWRTRRPVPRVVVAGQGPSYLALTARISAARAPVALLGHRRDVADLLAAADLAVVTSVWEARQLFAQEALRAGVPLVATAVGGLPELLGDAAVLVPPQDVDALDRAVQDLLDDPGTRARYAARGTAQAATWPTPAETRQQVATVYAALAEARSAGA